MNRAALILPHQLFEKHPALSGAEQVILVEEPLLFTQYRFHRQKLVFHRATMMKFADRLKQHEHKVHYVSIDQLKDTADIANVLGRLGIRSVQLVDPLDDWLDKRLRRGFQNHQIAATFLDDPHFLTSSKTIEQFEAGKKNLHFTDFYIEQRRRMGVLLTRDGKAVGGQWSFDPKNRKKLPKDVIVPPCPRPAEDEETRSARQYVRRNFPDAIGSDDALPYPTDHDSARDWLTNFIDQRLTSFGDYEDAISREHSVLFHSVLTPMLNVGLLSPRQVLDAALRQTGAVPLNSLEGFVRQVIGWREFVRLVYKTRGRSQRTRNFWNLTLSMPDAFYTASTGIEPVDHVIGEVLRTGYCHHIERLMVLGNFMLLCDIAPNAVYQWFMELFIDAYDWVMVPNVYGMSQYADGGLMTTKPYISGSNYIRKMSDFPKGPWCDIWDALYWRFIDRNEDFFLGNPRMAVMVFMKNKLGDKLRLHHRVADDYLSQLHGSC